MVVFGASGDLCTRKLLPALARLASRQELPGSFSVVGVARTEWDDDDFRRRARSAMATTGQKPDAWDIASEFRYIAGEYDRDDTFVRLSGVLDEVDRALGTDGNRLHYLAVPPDMFPVVIDGLRRHGLNAPPADHPGAFARIVIEKPFGHDLLSALELDRRVHAAFDESQVYRIDHYLGKETVQNVLALRFANSMFEPVWNRRYVDSVQVTVAESEGVGHRAAFYERTGALRDIVQNHIMQVLALTLMEPPITAEADGIRDEKVKLLRAVEIPDPRDVSADVVRAQYAAGWVDGRHVRGYCDEPGVPANSVADTYVALRIHVDNWRWSGVPIYLRTGKRLPKRVSEVAIRFQHPPHVPFAAPQIEGLEPDTLVLRIQPDDGIAVVFGAKVPGLGFQVRSVAMEFLYGSAFPGEGLDAYERLLLDAFLGDPTLFLRTDEVARAWAIVDPVQQAFDEGEPPITTYEAGSWGPEEADRLLARDGRRWREP
jgi:glucose-6-phosphate 1-dehydrogenase